MYNTMGYKIIFDLVKRSSSHVKATGVHTELKSRVELDLSSTEICRLFNSYIINTGASPSNEVATKISAFLDEVNECYK